ncbi:MAG: hypothetical protein WDZ61_00485 [Parcubacteria group bacterium]
METSYSPIAPNEKELTKLIKQTEDVVPFALDFRVKNSKDLERAEQGIKLLTEKKKAIDAWEEQYVRPLTRIARLWQDKLRPEKNRIAEADKALRNAIVAFREVLKEKEEHKAQEVEKSVREGKMSFQRASKALEKTQEKTEAISTRTERVVEVVDEKKIPREYLIPDMVRIRKEALAGQDIPGVKVTEQQIYVNR